MGDAEVEVQAGLSPGDAGFDEHLSPKVCPKGSGAYLPVCPQTGACLVTARNPNLDFHHNYENAF